jgi:hypothetical protein
MSQINVNNIRAKDGVSAVGFPGGINATGVVTATTFSGNLTGNVTGNVTGNLTGNVTGNVTGNADTATAATTATNAQGLSGTPNITVGSVTGSTASFSGNVSVGGTLTYEDVTNIDSVGIVTARSGLKVSSGGASFVGSLTERAVVSATALNADDFCNVDDGLFHYRTGNLGGTTNNLRLKSNVGFNTIMATGDVMNFTLAHNVNATTAYVNNVFIEGVAQTENWVGGSAPSDGGASGVDIYSFTIIKTAANTYTVIGNQTKTS